MLIVEAVVDERGNDAFTGDAHVPDWNDVHHMFRKLVVDQMPLLGKERILDSQTLRDAGCGGLWRWPYWWWCTLSALFGSLSREMPYRGANVRPSRTVPCLSLSQ